jgi:excisionase family DNA binding protein
MDNTDLDVMCPTDEETARAREVSGELRKPNSLGEPVRVLIDGAKAMELPPIVARLLIEILERTAAGHPVTLVPNVGEVTIEQAAEVLNVSPPFVVGMLEKGTLPSRLVGDQRRLPIRDVLAYKAENRAKRQETLREMAALDQELGIL